MATQLRSILAATLIAFGFSSSANAAAVTVDGVRDNLDNYTNSFIANWTQEHKPEFSVYNTGIETTRVWWEEENNSLFLYMEVPIYAKNMIWGNGVTQDDIDDYNVHYSTHHNDVVELDFGTATGSEKVVFGPGGGTTEKTTDKDSDKDGGRLYEGDLDGDATGPGIVQYKDSVDWLLNNNICDTTNCDASDVEMSFEFEFALDQIDKDALLASLQNEVIEFHLSPERGNPVPVPAAAWLFGSALMGMVGWRRRQQAKAAA